MFPWCITAPDGTILETFATSGEAYEATYEDRYGDDVEVGFISNPIPED